MTRPFCGRRVSWWEILINNLVAVGMLAEAKNRGSKRFQKISFN